MKRIALLTVMCCVPVASLGIAIAVAHTVQDHGNNGHGNNGRELARLADQYGADSYGFGSAGTTLGDGLYVLFSLPDFDVAIPGDEIEPGIYWGPLGLALQFTDGCNALTFDGIVIEFGDADFTLADGNLHVVCQSGWYACCGCANHCAFARCRRNSNQNDGDCQAGGGGATECSIPLKACAP